MNAPKCTHCNDTGEIGGYGYLDCTHCNAAEDRAALNAYVKELGPTTEYDLVWHVHQRALELARQEQAASIAALGIEAARTFDQDHHKSQ